MSRGKLITIEGIDGAGKSTLGAGLRDTLRERGTPVELLREPGGVRVAERIRELVKDPGATIGARAEALLYAAARAQLVEEALEPLLRDGQVVLLDRFVDSSLAYQGAGRGLGIEAVRQINAFGTGGLVPDRTLLLRLDPKRGLARSRQRGEPADRLELAGEAFFARIVAAYDELAAGEAGRIRTIDAGAPPEAVLRAALAEVADLV
ncbi:MAG: dTMP kinase [Solirubrobacteraceae bacterium]